MPMPKPKSGEGRSDFISRCMSELSSEFPDQDQRAAVCNSQWRDELSDLKFSDVMVLDKVSRRSDGYLVADARVARTGIQLYRGAEVGRPTMDIVRVYRSPEEVFRRDSMISFAHRPITNDHPPEAVNADNWKKYAVGNTVDEIARDGDLLRVPLMVSDGAAIADIESGKRELSAGYTAELRWGDGETPDGQKYDAIQTNIRANHIAIVQRGRAGANVRIGDADGHWGTAPITVADQEVTMNLRKVMVDGISVETTDAGAQAIEKLLADRASEKQKHDTELATKDQLIADKDKDIAKKDEEIVSLKGKVLDGPALDKRIRERAELVTQARAVVSDLKVEGLSDLDIRRRAIAAKYGEDEVKDKSDAYIDARFDVMVKDHKTTDPIRDGLRSQYPIQTQTNVQDADKAYEEACAQLRDAWQGKKEVA